MADYLRQKCEEIAQKGYLTQKNGGRLFWSDYYDLMALLLGIGLLAGAFYLQVNLDVFLGGLVVYSAVVWLGRRRLKSWQSRRLAYLTSYEKGWESFSAAWEKCDSAALKQEAERILAALGLPQEQGRFYWQKQWYMLKTVCSEQELAAVCEERSPQIVIVRKIDHKLKQQLKLCAAGKMILGDWRDLFALAVKYELVSLPEEELRAKGGQTAASPKMLLFYGLLLLALANVSRYFYLYFGGGILLLSFYLVIRRKKSADNEIVLLKKAMNLAKSRL